MEKGNDLRIALEMDNFRSNFSDLVQVETSPEHVYINFLERLPLSGENEPNAKVISRIVVSWPHFIRIVKLFNNVLMSNKNLAQDTFMSLMKEVEGSNDVRS
ncbi:DUF3467 domain-containing protein [Geobacillus thermoleovorans]|uniref:DUF3467 domain-containing protein n=1 Tax=Geobacillus kaustophilus (strain HTA426) TaxID=235909 RepID=Q5L2Q4_GEOKA|nr:MULTISPECIES: DUF3467 domain-containing protein [Geobacillus thermoleovorans group]OQP12816.1 hypothetical protein B1692_09995 [Geobacillus thermoleovorans]QNU22990.1 DUF3467 domain-containing protein [Geobacillus thermoleovorans]BAD74776.1 hypothetical protein GK0491 [Geobacillus kaustophilus HTA426]